MLKALFWKEWRESRLLLVIGLLLIALLFLDLFFSASKLLMFGGSVLIFCISLMGANAFSKEEGRLIFLLSKPVKKETIMTVKLVNGLLNTLIIEIIYYIVNMAIITYKNAHGQVLPFFYTHDFFTVGKIVRGTFTLLVYYIIPFFMSSLFLSAPISFMIGIFGAVYISSGLNYYLYKCGCSQFYPVIILNILFFFLLLSYLIFMRREVRH